MKNDEMTAETIEAEIGSTIERGNISVLVCNSAWSSISHTIDGNWEESYADTAYDAIFCIRIQIQLF